MSAPIDVLAVMDRDAVHAAGARCGISPEYREWSAESREARAAVAELIAAGKDPDLFRRPDNRDAETKARIYAAKRRYAAALARVGAA